MQPLPKGDWCQSMMEFITRHCTIVVIVFLAGAP